MDYHSYLVRVWREEPEEEIRLSIQKITTGEWKYFTHMMDLLSFLCGEMQIPEIFNRQPEAVAVINQKVTQKLEE